MYKVKILGPNATHSHPVGRLDISVGQPYHEGEKLAAAMRWAHNRFGHVIVSVADTLQRFNLMADGVEQGVAWQKSYDAGTEWIVRNAGVLNGCTVIRWDERVRHPLFQQFMMRTLDLIRDDVDLMRQMHAAANQYADRRGLHHAAPRMGYLIEEMAVFDMLFRLEPAADVYPGSILPFWSHPAYGDRAAFTRIDFVRRVS